MATVSAGAPLRIASASGKGGQANLIQLASTGAGGVPQFAMLSQGSLLSLGGSRIVPQVIIIVLCRELCISEVIDVFGLSPLNRLAARDCSEKFKRICETILLKNLKLVEF